MKCLKLIAICNKKLTIRSQQVKLSVHSGRLDRIYNHMYNYVNHKFTH